MKVYHRHIEINLTKPHDINTYDVGSVPISLKTALKFWESYTENTIREEFGKYCVCDEDESVLRAHISIITTKSTIKTYNNLTLASKSEDLRDDVSVSPYSHISLLEAMKIIKESTIAYATLRTADLPVEHQWFDYSTYINHETLENDLKVKIDFDLNEKVRLTRQWDRFDLRVRNETMCIKLYNNL